VLEALGEGTAFAAEHSPKTSPASWLQNRASMMLSAVQLDVQ